MLGYEFALAVPSGTACRLLQRLYAGSGRPTCQEQVPCFALQRVQGTTGTGWRVLLDGRCLAELHSLIAALQQLEYEICTRIIAAHTDWIVLHGAVVVSPHGAAVIAGPSGAGKTTLALALATRGWRVAGDDVALLDPATGELWPVPRCAHLDRRSRALLRHLGLQVPATAWRYGFVTPADLGTATPAGVRVRHFLLLRQGGEGPPVITASAHAETLVWLLGEAGWTGQPASAVLSALGTIVGEAACYQVTRGTLVMTVNAVAALLAH